MLVTSHSLHLLLTYIQQEADAEASRATNRTITCIGQLLQKGKQFQNKTSILLCPQQKKLA